MADDWLKLLAVVLVPVVTIGMLGFVLVIINKPQTTVFQRDANGNIVAISTV